MRFKIILFRFQSAPETPNFFSRVSRKLRRSFSRMLTVETASDEDETSSANKASSRSASPSPRSQSNKVTSDVCSSPQIKVSLECCSSPVDEAEQAFYELEFLAENDFEGGPRCSLQRTDGRLDDFEYFL